MAHVSHPLAINGGKTAENVVENVFPERTVEKLLAAFTHPILFEALLPYIVELPKMKAAVNRAQKPAQQGAPAATASAYEYHFQLCHSELDLLI
jgi:hypothetical protein